MSNNYCFLTIYRFASTALRIAVQVILLPLLILQIADPTQKGSYLSMITVISIAIGFPIFLLSAYLGDILNLKQFRRRIFIILGVLLIFFGMILVWRVHNIKSLLLASMLIFSGISMSESSHSALIPDNVAQENYHRAASWLACFTFLGSLFGPLLAGLLTSPTTIKLINGLFHKEIISNVNFYIPSVIALMMTIVICALMNIFLIKECAVIPADHHDSGKRIWQVLFSFDIKMKCFWIYFLMRCFAALTASTFPGFILYYQRDMISAANPEMATAVSFVLLTMGALFGISYIKLKLIAHYSPIKIITIALITMSTAILSFVLVTFTNVLIWYVAITFYGIGYGLFFSISFSYAMTIIPDPKWKGLFTSMVSSTTFVAYILGMAIAGPLLDFFNRYSINMGYGALEIFFIFSLLCAMLLLQLLRWLSP